VEESIKILIAKMIYQSKESLKGSFNGKRILSISSTLQNALNEGMEEI
jgi:hypothetical protein